MSTLSLACLKGFHHEIIEKAEGVFLWVSMVVRLLLAKLQRRDTLANLHTTFTTLPSDIAQLYQTMWPSVEPRNVPNSSEVFQLVHAAFGPLDVMDLWLSNEKKSVDFDITSASLSEHFRNNIVSRMKKKKRFDNLTKGILEISPNGTIDFLHRTAQEWITQENVWENICSKSTAEFDPCLALLKSSIIGSTIFSGSEWLSRKNWEESWEWVVHCFRYAAQVEDSSAITDELVKTLDALDAKATRLTEVANNELLYYGSRLHHWSSHQTWGLFDNTFLGLAPPFVILPYIQRKVLTQSDLLKTNSTTLSVLDNAVFGWELLEISSTWAQTDFRDLSFAPTRRLQRVRFLLDHSARPGNVTLLGDVYQVEVFDRLEDFGPNHTLWEARGEELSYYDHVVIMLKKAGGVKDKLNRALLKVRGLAEFVH